MSEPADTSDTQEISIDEFIELMDGKKLVVPDMLITLKQVKQLVQRSHSAIYKQMNEGNLPKQHPHLKGMWALSTIKHYIKTGEIDN